MKIRITFVVVISFLTTLFSIQDTFSQDYIFKVLLENGQALVKSNESWQELQRGTALGMNDILQLKEGAYLGLVHSGGHTLAIDKPGIYAVHDLATQFVNPSAGIALKYAELLLDAMDSHKVNLAYSLERSDGKEAKLQLLLPTSVAVYSKEVIVRWNEVEAVDVYEVVLKNMFDEVIKSEEVSDTQYTLDFTDNTIAQEKLVIISVKAKGEQSIQSGNYGIKPLSSEEATFIKKELDNLKREISEKESALDKLLLASFYEQNNLLIDALTNYEYAIRHSPNVEAFKTAYHQFLLRNGLSRTIN
jgi:hypothetical protein